MGLNSKLLLIIGLFLAQTTFSSDLISNGIPLNRADEVTRLLALSYAPALGDVNYAVGRAFQVSFSSVYKDTSEISRLGDGRGRDQVFIPSISISKGVYSNIDFEISAIPPTEAGVVLSGFGGSVRLTKHFKYFTFKPSIYSYSLNYENKLNISSSGASLSLISRGRHFQFGGKIIYEFVDSNFEAQVNSINILDTGTEERLEEQVGSGSVFLVFSRKHFDFLLSESIDLDANFSTMASFSIEL